MMVVDSHYSVDLTAHNHYSVDLTAQSHYSVDLTAQNHYSVAQSHYSPYMMVTAAAVVECMTLSYTHRNSAVPAVDMQQAQACHNWDLPQ